MPTAPVDQHGSVLYYEDSGVPGTSTDYVTVVLIHGTCFHSGARRPLKLPSVLYTLRPHVIAGYRPLIPLAEAHNLRLVLLNLRGYPGLHPTQRKS